MHGMVAMSDGMIAQRVWARAGTNSVTRRRGERQIRSAFPRPPRENGSLDELRSVHDDLHLLPPRRERWRQQDAEDGGAASTLRLSQTARREDLSAKRQRGLPQR